MTRINVVDPKELTDQHLLVELRELPRMFTYMEKHMVGKKYSGPAEYTMGAGHMKFFSNKGKYLYDRMYALYEESVVRGFKFNFDKNSLDFRYKMLDSSLQCGYDVTTEALEVNRKRLAEKLAMRPDWYRYYGKKLS